MKLLMAALTSLALLAPAAAQQEFVVTTGNTPDCSLLDKVSGFDVNYFSIGGTDHISMSSGGASSGKLELGPLVIHKNFDACSEALLKSFLSGAHSSKVTLTEYRTAGDSGLFAVMSISLSNAIITDYKITNADTRVSNEVISFDYTKACISSTAQNPDGSVGTKTTVCYDLLKGIVTSGSSGG